MTDPDPNHPLESALADLRISGTIVLHECYRAPWAIDIPDEAGLRRLFGLAEDARAFPFHLVEHGGFELEVAGDGHHRIGTSDIVLCTSGAAHRMRAGKARDAQPLARLLEPDGSTPNGGAGEPTTLVCGVFVLADSPFNPLLTDLPPVLVTPTAADEANAVLASAASLLTGALEAGAGGRAFASARALEVLCAELIRHHARTVPADAPGWFAGLTDPRIGVALRHIHAAPGRPRSVAELASLVSLSPSRFAARFREQLGISVQRYVTTQRLSHACKLLASRKLSVSEVAFEVGYASVPAFSRAFRGHVGTAPGAWRNQR